MFCIIALKPQQKISLLYRVSCGILFHTEKAVQLYLHDYVKRLCVVMREQTHMNKDIDVIRDIIVGIIDPDKIILFGSYAYGSPTEISDADFLVIKNGIEHTNRDNAKLSTEIFCKRRELGIRTRCDVFLENEQSANEISQNGGAYSDALKRGKVIYVR